MAPELNVCMRSLMTLVHGHVHVRTCSFTCLMGAKPLWEHGQKYNYSTCIYGITGYLCDSEICANLQTLFMCGSTWGMAII